MSHDGLDFIFFSSSNQLQWWAAIVDAMLNSFMIRSQQRGMEDIINGPGWGEVELISYW